MLDVSLFGPVTFPIAILFVILVTRPVAVFIPALCGLRFLVSKYTRGAYPM